MPKISWYDFRNDGTRTTYNEHNFGIVHNEAYNCAPKPAAVAYRVMTEEIGDRPFRRMRKPEEGVYLATFGRSGGPKVTVAWSVNGEVELDVSGDATVRNLVGNSVSAESGLTVDGSPVYVRGEGVSVELAD